jgi:hypothetical protein
MRRADAYWTLVHVILGRIAGSWLAYDVGKVFCMDSLLSRRQLLACGAAMASAAQLLSAEGSTTAPATAPGGAGDEVWNVLPVRALLLSAPAPADVELFCEFIRKTLPAEGVNTLVVRFRYCYQFASHPELTDVRALSCEQVRAIADACRDAGVKLIPKMNLLAHQSEEARILPLLAKYPQLDESPDFGPPDPWVDARSINDFYSKSVCSLHPQLDKIVFALMDELVDVCQADAFHVGLDEVWIIGHPTCPRCGGKDPAELFAGYTTRLHDHLARRGCRMWMWSDRLLDGKTTNLLGWQASMNNTHRAIDLIPKGIMICDWKYEDAPPTPGYFAVKGFEVLTCPCASTEAALAQLEQTYLIRKNATRAEFSKPLSFRMKGVFETSWMSAKSFINGYHGKADDEDGAAAARARANADTFKALFAQIRRRATA